MRVLGKDKVHEFKRKHSTSRSALDRFIVLLESCDAKNPLELKQTFPSADRVGSKTVFNVGGNKVRAIALIEFGLQVILITDVLTHNEYDLGKWKD